MSLNKTIENKYLDMSDDDIDSLLFGLDVSQTNVTKKETNHNVCSSCQSSNIIIKTQGEKVCKDCGVSEMNVFNHSTEYNENDNSYSYGCPSNHFFPKSSLGTSIKCKGYSRLSLIQKQGQMPYKEKSLLETLKKIQQKCVDYGIDQSTIDTAKLLYKKISDSKHTTGKRKGKSRIMRCVNLISIIAACLFNACKMQGKPRSPKEIADIYDLEIKNINNGCRKFEELVGINTVHTENKTSTSTDFIERFGKKLNMSDEHIKITKNMSINIEKLDIASTHEPPSIAAGCILLVSTKYNLGIDKKEISDVFKISDVTISKTFRKINPFYKIIQNNNITNLVHKKLVDIPKKNVDFSKDELVVKCSEKEKTVTKKAVKKKKEDNKPKKPRKKKSDLVLSDDN